tara:strand:- start:39 stop:182 length:144 start_codon:yes stop_codon:yes gene_type:complete
MIFICNLWSDIGWVLRDLIRDDFESEGKDIVERCEFGVDAIFGFLQF